MPKVRKNKRDTLEEQIEESQGLVSAKKANKLKAKLKGKKGQQKQADEIIGGDDSDGEDVQIEMNVSQWI